MPKFIDLTGERFGRLVVVKQLEDHITSGGSHQKQWLCRCDCGNTSVTTTQNLRSGDTRSCGCLEIESKILRNATHNCSNTRMYNIWQAMKSRCNNPHNQDYDRYGERGIKVCEDWDHEYTLFRDWAINNGYDNDLTLDRIDPNGNYEPSNCRWVNMRSQNNNRTNNVVYEYNGETHTVAEWARIYNMPYSRLYMRLYNGLSIEEALNYTNNNSNK